MEYVPDVELFSDPLKGPNVPSGDLKQLAQSSPMVPTERLGPALAACARVGFPGSASKQVILWSYIDDSQEVERI